MPTSVQSNREIRTGNPVYGVPLPLPPKLGHATALHYTILHYTILYYTTLPYIALHYIAFRTPRVIKLHLFPVYHNPQPNPTSTTTPANGSLGRNEGTKLVHLSCYVIPERNATQCNAMQHNTSALHTDSGRRNQQELLVSTDGSMRPNKNCVHGHCCGSLQEPNPQNRTQHSTTESATVNQDTFAWDREQ
eukprot:jgi/Psemu1/1551/gm1.1551_g